MSWDVRQTRRFARVYKKLHDNMLAEVDAAVEAVACNPDSGEKKKGDLAELWVLQVPLPRPVVPAGLHPR